MSINTRGFFVGKHFGTESYLMSMFFVRCPSTAFGHSDRKKRALTGRFCKTFIQFLSVKSQQIWVTVTAFCDFFRKYFEISLEGFL
jgi:hypothetical protein